VVAPSKAGVEGERNNVGLSLIASPIDGEILVEVQIDRDELIAIVVDIDDVIEAVEI